MTCSEMIDALAALREQHGDLQVGALNHEFGCSHPATLDVVATNRPKEGRGCFTDAEALGPTFVRVR